MYVGDDKKLHFVDKAGADSVLPFSNEFKKVASHVGVAANSPGVLYSNVSDNWKCYVCKWVDGSAGNSSWNTYVIKLPDGTQLAGNIYVSGNSLIHGASSSTNTKVAYYDVYGIE